MGFLLVCGLVVFATIVLCKYKQRRDGNFRGRRILPPGPPPLPAIGNIHQLGSASDKTHIRLHELSREYGPIMWLKVGSVPTLVISSARLAKEVFKTHDAVFSDRPVTLATHTIFFGGVEVAFSPYGDYWREIRKITTLHLFSNKQVAASSYIREEEVARMLRYISTSGEPMINLSEMIVYLVNSVINRLSFGKRLDGDNHESCRKCNVHHLLIKLQKLMMTFSFTDFLPIIGWADRITGFHSELREATNQLSSFFQENIDEHIHKVNKSHDKEDMLHILLRLKANGSCITDVNQIKGLLSDIFLGGIETSSATLIWAMTQLMRHPAKMKRAQDEIRSLVKNRHERNVLNQEEIQNMPYLKAVMKETFRLNPTAPLLLPRQSTESCHIDGYHIPTGTRLIVNVWAIGRDPHSWINPLEFYPERFLNVSMDFKGQDFELLPFGGGRRSCPAMNLGIAMVELVLANLIYWFDWELPGDIKPEDINMDSLPGITVCKKDPLELHATPYNPQE